MKVKKKNKNKPTADQMRLAKIKKKNASSKSAVKTNLFEIKMNKQKHNILNRKNKNHVGLPGVSRSAAIKKVFHILCLDFSFLFLFEQIKKIVLSEYINFMFLLIFE